MLRSAARLDVEARHAADQQRHIATGQTPIGKQAGDSLATDHATTPVENHCGFLRAHFSCRRARSVRAAVCGCIESLPQPLKVVERTGLGTHHMDHDMD